MQRKTLDERLTQYNTRKALDTWKRSSFKSKETLKKRVLEIITRQHSLYVTFTIAPKNYGHDTMTYIRKTKEALAMASDYVANEDIGKDKGRYHIHALVSFPERFDFTIKPNKLEEIWKYGTIYFEPIHTPNQDAITNYMNKLSSHATKKTAHRIIYSRKKRA